MQRGAPAPVWGWSDAGRRRFGGQSHATTAAPDGSWTISLDALEARAEPREFTVESDNGTDTVRLQDVVVGEVRLRSGQSNTAMPYRGYGNQPIRGSSNAIAHPVAVRYAWENWLVGTLFNTAGLPASSFRTDKW